MLISRKKYKDQDDADRYLITYADLITLLLGLFVILYAASKIDHDKYNELRTALSGIFAPGGASPMDMGEGVLEGHKGIAPVKGYAAGQEYSMDRIYNDVGRILKTYIDKGMVSVARKHDAVMLTLPEKLLFESAHDEITTAGQPILDTLAVVLSNVPYLITVDGHTDSDPIRSTAFRSNWHLSVSRAVNAAHIMIRKGVPKSNLVIRGFGDQRPVAPNSDEEGKARNRRVEITISELPPDMQTVNGMKNKD